MTTLTYTRYAPDHDDVYTADDDGDSACDEDMCPYPLWLQDAPGPEDEGRPLDWYPTMDEMAGAA